VTTSLTKRDANAPTLEPFLNLDAPSDADREVVQALPSPAADDAKALDLARLEPLNDFQRGLHEAASLLAPLTHGVAAIDHVLALRSGFRPLIQKLNSPAEVLPYLRNILQKLLP
jgi:phospholipase C